MIITDRSLQTGTEWDEYFHQSSHTTSSVIDVVRIMSKGKIDIRHDHVVLMLGNHHMPPILHDPVRGIKNLIYLVKSQRPTATVYVCGVLPRADDESFLTPPIVEINKSLSSMTNIVKKMEKVDVKWVALYKLFLERVRYEVPISEDSRFHTRVARPYDTYFREDGKDLNEHGRLKVVKFLLALTGIKPGCSDWKGIPQIDENVQDQKILINIMQCRGKSTKEWEDEDEVERILRQEDMMVVDEIGASTDDDSGDENQKLGERKNLTIHIDWSDYQDDMSEKEKAENPWFRELACQIIQENPKSRKKHLSCFTSSDESVEVSPQAIQQNVLAEDTDSDDIKLKPEEKRVVRELVRTVHDTVEETDIDDLGEDTIVDVALGD